MVELQTHRTEKQLESARRFRELYEGVERIFTLTSAPELMSFGPSIVAVEGAMDEGWLGSLAEFKPMLRATDVSDVAVELDGEIYSHATFFFKRGGNPDADKNWLGNVRFAYGLDELMYEFYIDGRIKLTKQPHFTRWVSTCWAQEEEMQELSDAFSIIKQQLHAPKVGEVALS